jgi:hypothetical protein
MDSNELVRNTDVGSGMLCFLGEPVFRTHLWTEDDLTFLQTEELDLVASARSVEETADKLGNMIVDLLSFLVDEVDDPSDTEVETIRLITERIGPPLLKFHREQQRADLLHRLRRQFRSTIEWKVGPPSTQPKYVHALPC